jgi:hypothetical protein
MTQLSEDVVRRVVEDSAIVRTIERAALTVGRWTAGSRTGAASAGLLALAAAWPGHLLLSAGLTHIVLMIVMARPVSWMWAILPAMAVALGLVLIVFPRPWRTEQ